jgi:hypothetical protein
MEYIKFGKTGKLKSKYVEEVKEGTVRYINRKLYYCSEQFQGGYGFRETTWTPIDINKILKGD